MCSGLRFKGETRLQKVRAGFAYATLDNNNLDFTVTVLISLNRFLTIRLLISWSNLPVPF